MSLITPEQLHKWYLEATTKLHPESFNPNAQKSYSELTEEQKFIDKYISDAIMRAVEKRFKNTIVLNGHIQGESDWWRTIHLPGSGCIFDIMKKDFADIKSKLEKG